MERKIYDNYLTILKAELLPAMGCTEPIAVAFAAAKARAVLGKMPERMEMYCSGNIVKNVKGVVVPNSGGQLGIDVAAVLGVVGGREDLELEVLNSVTEEQIEKTRELVKSGMCDCRLVEGEENLYIRAEVFAGEDKALVELKTKHNHISRIEKNGEILFAQDDIEAGSQGDKSQLNLKDIYEFANTVDVEDVRGVLERQMKYNKAISEEGLRNPWGAQVGRTLLEVNGDSDWRVRAKAAAAAGSDARMGGCALPVVINSGSGNQGMTASIPVIVYAKECNVSQDMLYRALIVSNLVTIHLKTGIGSLSAYCGATSAGAGAGAGICYLYGGHYDEIAHTVVNALAINSGMLCDGAKASCAAKIASAVEAGLLGMQMYMHDSQFYSGDGLVASDVEDTIRTVSAIAREGMRETDSEIIHFMIGNDCGKSF